MAESSGLILTPSGVQWERVRSDQVQEQVVKVAAADGAPVEWSIKSCPWWLDARRDGDSLFLRPRHCGRYSGFVTLSNQGPALRARIRSVIEASGVTGWNGAEKAAIGSLLGSLAGLALLYAGSALLGYLANAVPVPEGPIAVALSMAGFVGAWGAVIGAGFGLLVGGKDLALRSAAGGFFGLLVVFGLGTPSYADLSYGAEMVMKGPVAGALASFLWGAVAGGAWLAERAAIVGSVMGAAVLFMVYNEGYYFDYPGGSLIVFVSAITIGSAIVGHMIAPLRPCAGRVSAGVSHWWDALREHTKED